MIIDCAPQPCLPVTDVCLAPPSKALARRGTIAVATCRIVDVGRAIGMRVVPHGRGRVIVNTDAARFLRTNGAPIRGNMRRAARYWVWRAVHMAIQDAAGSAESPPWLRLALEQIGMRVEQSPRDRGGKCS